MSRDRMQRQRFEHKYMVNEEVALGIRDFLTPYLVLDENGVGKAQNSYPVHSLYFDSDRLATFWSTINGDRNRFKLRVRFYDDDPRSPVFFEIKRRVNNCILKQRGGVRKEAVRLLFSGQLPSYEHLLRADAKSLFAVQNFFELAERLQARPIAHVAYLREAYVEPETDNVRLTLDRCVRTEPRSTPTFGTEMKNFSRPFGDRVILEVKFTDRFPQWCNALISHFNLMQCGAAKYCEGLAGLSKFAVSHVGDFREHPEHIKTPLRVIEEGEHRIIRKSAPPDLILV
jgi:hypothetical protein